MARFGGLPEEGCVRAGEGWHRGMKNVEIQVEGSILTLRVDLSKEFGPSSSGKTTIVASTEGNVSVPDHEVKVGLNVYRPRPSRDA